VIQIDAALGWSIVVVLTVLVFAAGGAWVRLSSVDKRTSALDTDLRTHMGEEQSWRLDHVQHGGHRGD